MIQLFVSVAVCRSAMIIIIIKPFLPLTFSQSLKSRTNCRRVKKFSLSFIWSLGFFMQQLRNIANDDDVDEDDDDEDETKLFTL